MATLTITGEKKFMSEINNISDVVDMLMKAVQHDFDKKDDNTFFRSFKASPEVVLELIKKVKALRGCADVLDTPDGLMVLYHW
jgi:hypothetical protein